MAQKRVHITLSKDLLGDPSQLDAVAEQVQAAADMTDINARRLKRYGILSGVVQDDKISALAELPGVDAVSEDEQRRAI